MMRITYDKEADAMYIQLRKGNSYKTAEIDDSTIADYDKQGRIIGIEILFVKERNPSLLKTLEFENLA